MSQNKELSIVIPVYNEEANLPELLRRTRAACDELQTRYEIILVDDGSVDRSARLINQAAQRDPETVIGVFLSANFGQHAAIMAGFEISRGDYVITMDADLQNYPEEIGRLLLALRGGYDIVGTIRADRQDTVFRKMSSKLVNLMVRQLCRGKTMQDYGCMLRGYARPVVDAVLQCPEHGKFIPMLAMSFASRTAEIPVRHAERSAGESKYSFWKLIALQYDLLTGTSVFPLRMLTIFGFLLAAFGVLFGIAVFVHSQLDKSWGAEGIFALFAVQFVFAGITLAALGLIGEYIGKIHLNARARPQYFIGGTTLQKPAERVILLEEESPHKNENFDHRG